MTKTRICMNCYEELAKAHLSEGEVRFCDKGCKDEFLGRIPPNANLKMIKEILE